VLDLRDSGAGEQEDGDEVVQPSSGPPLWDSAGSLRSVRLKNGAVSSLSDRDGILGTIRALCA